MHSASGAHCSIFRASCLGNAGVPVSVEYLPLTAAYGVPCAQQADSNTAAQHSTLIGTTACFEQMTVAVACQSSHGGLRQGPTAAAAASAGGGAGRAVPHRAAPGASCFVTTKPWTGSPMVTWSHSGGVCPQELGVPAADIKKLKEGGINTVEALARATKRELCNIKGISEAKVTKLLQEGEHSRRDLHAVLLSRRPAERDSGCCVVQHGS